jgi:NAD(P)-dependent dehydrogenase (short-subunit alcohol dehydrogenase family)
LGTALVRRLLRQDVRLAITYLLPEEAARFEQEFDVDEDRVMLRRVDATNAESIGTFMKTIAEGHGPIAGLACLVGGWAGGRDVEDTDDVRFDRMIDLNLRSSFYAVRAAIPHMKDSAFGRIVLVGSRAGIENPPGQASFNMAKAGVMALGRSIASELEPSGVTAAVLVPSVIDTPATRATLPYADYVNWPTPDEIASVADFLLSEDAGVMNGALVPVYGKA